MTNLTAFCTVLSSMLLNSILTFDALGASLKCMHHSRSSFLSRTGLAIAGRLALNLRSQSTLRSGDYHSAD